VDTRRRAACDLVKALSKEFEQVTMSSFGLYVKVRFFSTLKLLKKCHRQIGNIYIIGRYIFTRIMN